jgi:hypothetical protein
MLEIPIEIVIDLINNTDFLELIVLFINNISCRFYVRLSNNILFIKIYDNILLLTN